MIEVTNINELLVADLIDELTSAKKDKKMCYCDVCVTDIMTITLNNLKPRYVASPLTETFFKPSATKKEQANLIRAVFENAVQKVKKSPRH